MARPEVSEKWEVANLKKALADVGLAPTLLDLSFENEPTGDPTACGREVLPWAAHMAAALAPASELRPAFDRAPEPGPPIFLVPLAAPVPLPARKMPSPRRRSRWPVALCGIVALVAGTAAVIHCPASPISLRSRARATWVGVVAASSQVLAQVR